MSDSKDTKGPDSSDSKGPSATLEAENAALKAELAELKARYAQLGEEVRAMFGNSELMNALMGNPGPVVAGGTSRSMAAVQPGPVDVLQADSSAGYVALGGATLGSETSVGKFVGVPMDEDQDIEGLGEDTVCVEKTGTGKYPELGICGYPKGGL
jgi:hypothetical protein